MYKSNTTLMIKNTYCIGLSVQEIFLKYIKNTTETTQQPIQQYIYIAYNLTRLLFVPLTIRTMCRVVRRRPHVGVAVAPAPFSWNVHVVLYTSYMLLDFCNAVYNVACTLTKSSKNDASKVISRGTRENDVPIVKVIKNVLWTALE